MADTRIQLEIADWIRTVFLPRIYLGERFSKAKVALDPGGVHEFNAVNYGRDIIVNITTSDAKTASGKLAVGKVTKVRADMFFLTMTNATTKVMAFTEKDMYDLVCKERELGRVPHSIELMLVKLPHELQEKLAMSKREASDEVSP